jgi:hypothetical protein
MATIDTLQTGSSNYAIVVAIEGLEYLITDGSTSAATTAWSGTEWSQALGGLQVQWNLRQKLAPWKPVVESSHITLVVQQHDDGDILGTRMFASNGGEETMLDATIDSDATTITVKSTADFASSGSIHIGTEHITYTGKTATTFTTCTRGRYAPFKANTEAAQRFGRAHDVPVVGDGYVVKARVTSQQRVWVGRWVGVWLHARSGTTLDTKANAFLAFAGRIASFRDAENGLTYIEVEPAVKALNDVILFQDQWSAKVADGISLRAGDRFDASDTRGNASAALTANPLIVVASGASGANEIDAGLYSNDELADALNEWFAAEKAATRLNFSWSWTPVVMQEGGPRSMLRWEGGHATQTNTIQFDAPRDVFNFMGWSPGTLTGRLGLEFLSKAWASAVYYEHASPSRPYRRFVRGQEDNVLEVSDVRGTWWNNRDYLPPHIGGVAGESGSYAVLRVGDSGPLMVFKEETPGESIRIHVASHPILSDIIPGPFDIELPVENILFGANLRVDEEGDIPLTQVALISGDFADLLTKLLASTGTTGYNHATWDVFPFGLGAAIPWELLGANWTKAADHIAEAGSELLIVLEKPTKLLEVIAPDLSARVSSLCWRSQALGIASWAPPATVVSSHTLTEANKASAADAQDNHRTVAQETDEHLVNVIKLNYNRVLDGGAYQSTLNIVDKSSQQDTGLHRPVTIELRNLYGKVATANATVEKLADHLAGVMGMYSKPMRIIRRTVAPEFYPTIAPGDICSVTDDFVRDPDTGARGISNRAALVIGVELDYGGYEIDTGQTRPMLGQVDLLLWPREHIVAYSPCAQVDDTQANAGYNAGTRTLTFYAHEHSLSTQSVDVSNFVATDAVRIIEIDPDDPASPTTWTDTIVSVNAGANTCVLTTGLAGWDATKRYRMISANWASATVTQQARCYQADDADGMVVNDPVAFEYGGTVAGTAVTSFSDTGAELPALYAQAAYGDGVPLDVGYERDAARLLNNLARFRTAPMMPALNAVHAANSMNGGSHVRAILSIEPVILHPGHLGKGTRSLIVRIWHRSSSGSADLYVTFSRKAPYGRRLYTTDADAPSYFFERPYTTRTVVSSSTTWGASSQLTFDYGIADLALGEGYIIVEGEPNAEYRGMAMCHLGPYQAG